MVDAKMFKPLLVSASIALAGIATLPTPSHARDGRNAAAAAGAVAGFAAGATLGGAAPVYQAPPVRERRVIVEDDGEDCFVRTRRIWAGDHWRTRRVTVCE